MAFRLCQLLIVLIVGLGSLMANGCGNAFAPLPSHAQGAESRNPDRAIFDVVLSDLIENPAFDPAVGGRHVKKSQIVLGDMTQHVSERLICDECLQDERVIPLELRADLVKRNPRTARYSLAAYHPANPDILVRDPREIDLDLEFANEFPNARGYVLPNLPGYSVDGRTAVFRFILGPTPHGARGFYLLERRAGGWEITGRFLGYAS